MAGIVFRKASQKSVKLRLALSGPEGSGKTWTALEIATGIAGPGGKILLLDSEHGSSEMYSKYFDFDVAVLPSFEPRTYIEYIKAAGAQGYQVLVIDSLSHAWIGIGGALQMVDDIAKKSGATNNFTAWRSVTPEHNHLVDVVLAYPSHVVATMRSKTAFALDQSGGKTSVRKLGLEVQQRDGILYEFGVCLDLQQADHDCIVTKTRIKELDGRSWIRPTRSGELVRILNDCLSDLTSELAQESVTVTPDLSTRIQPNTSADTPEERHAAIRAYLTDVHWTDAQITNLIEYGASKGDKELKKAFKAVVVDRKYDDQQHAEKFSTSQVAA